MRIDLPDDSEASKKRALGRKQVGRKHLHQPRGRAIERRRLRLKRRAEELVRERQAFNALVSAYWRGERETYPDGP